MKPAYLLTLKKQAEKTGLRELAKKTVSRQSLYNLFQNKDVRLSTLKSVAKHLGYDLNVELTPRRTLDTKHLHSALRKLGAPLYDNEVTDFSLEQVVAWGLKAALKDKTVADVLPYVLAMNAADLDMLTLLQYLREDQQRQLLGYFSDLANQFAPNAKLNLLVDLLDRQFPVTDLTGKAHGKFAERYFLSLKNATAQKWNVRTFSTTENLLERYRKWQRLNT
ncbi:MAG: hypothetical protein KF799_06015 [Bdellovibrionales bacterium]|nr:hypothetical protein [Bdellovibrionales bacterium]